MTCGYSAPAAISKLLPLGFGRAGAIRESCQRDVPKSRLLQWAAPVPSAGDYFHPTLASRLSSDSAIQAVARRFCRYATFKTMHREEYHESTDHDHSSHHRTALCRSYLSHWHSDCSDCPGPRRNLDECFECERPSGWQQG